MDRPVATAIASESKMPVVAPLVLDLDDGPASLANSRHPLLRPPPADTRNLILLFALYLVHGLPLVFSWSTMPILLREQASYLAVGSFVLAQYPYSLKIMWSPLVESFSLPWLGPKKSWLVPSYLANAAMLFWLARYQDGLIRDIGAGSNASMAWLLLAWCGVNMSCANIRIALDAWALELVSADGIRWFGSVVSVSETGATFLSLNLFLLLAGAGVEAVSATTYFMLAAGASAATAGLVLFKRESSHSAPKSALAETYAIIGRILRLPHIWTLFAVHLVSLVGFITNDTVTVLQLVKLGFGERGIGILATITFPVALTCGLAIARLFRTRHPLQVWRALFPVRLLAAVLAQVGVGTIFLLTTGHEAPPPLRFAIAILPDMMTTCMDTAMFVCLITFHAEISDPAHGAIYLPLLATTLDLRYALLQFVSTKTIGWIDGGQHEFPARLVDGYQIVNAAGVLLALPLFWFYLRPATRWLQSLERDQWRVGAEDKGYLPVALEEREEHESTAGGSV